MQVRIIEHNDNEGESFSYVLEVSNETSEKLVEIFDEFESDEWEIETNTNYTLEKVNELNKHVDNNYMDYIGFYAIPEGAELSEDIFYKGNGLIEL